MVAWQVGFQSFARAGAVGYRIQTLAALLLFCASAPGAGTTDASPWDGDQRSAVRLIAGAAPTPGAEQLLRAGIEVRLGRGWKTYWRYPGDSGVPPRFNFSRSENLQRAEVLWPAPKSFSDGNGKSIGYSDDVVLPLRLVAEDANHPVLLRLDIDYAVCDTLCVPASAHAELALPVPASSHEPALLASEARVPLPAAIGSGDALAVLAVAQENGPPHPRIVVDVRAPEADHVALFAEGPSPDWALPIPQLLTTGPSGPRRFGFELDGLPAGTKPEGARIKLTAVWQDKAIEVEFQVH
jgi:DsbC/DsbD-like thiol-disulfide interchange protein